jgi:hypothetical protein
MTAVTRRAHETTPPTALPRPTTVGIATTAIIPVTMPKVPPGAGLPARTITVVIEHSGYMSVSVGTEIRSSALELEASLGI